jgi:hypothetical protein
MIISGESPAERTHCDPGSHLPPTEKEIGEYRIYRPPDNSRPLVALSTAFRKYKTGKLLSI